MSSVALRFKLTRASGEVWEFNHDITHDTNSDNDAYAPANDASDACSDDAGNTCSDDSADSSAYARIEDAACRGSDASSDSSAYAFPNDATCLPRPVWISCWLCQQQKKSYNSRYRKA